MNWPRTILDGIMLCLVFNLLIALLWTFIPGSFKNMLPAEIRKAAPPRKKKEVIINLNCSITMGSLVNETPQIYGAYPDQLLAMIILLSTPSRYSCLPEQGIAGAFSSAALSASSASVTSPDLTFLPRSELNEA